MEHDGRELIVAIRHHGVEDGIVELSQRGIRGNAADDGVETLEAQGFGEVVGAGLFEIAAIGHAADDGKAPLLGLDRKLRGRHDRPHHEFTLEVGVRGVTLVVRKRELAGSELPGVAHHLQAFLQCGVGLGIGQHVRDRLARIEYLQLPLGSLGHIKSAAAAECEADEDQEPGTYVS